MSTGGSGTGVAQDASLQAMIAALRGVSYDPSFALGGDGRGVAQDASLQEIISLLQGGAGGGSPYNPIGAGPWYIAPQTGNDSNNGTDPSTPKKTWRGLLKAWGASPLCVDDTQVVYLESALDASDPIDTWPVTFVGGSLLVYANLPAPSAAGTVTAFTPFNRAFGVAQKNTFVDSAKGNGFFIPYIDALVIFTNTNSIPSAVAWIVGAVAENKTVEISTPYAPTGPGDAPGGVPYGRGTVAVGYTYAVYQLIQVFCGRAATNVAGGDFTSYESQFVKMYHLDCRPFSGSDDLQVMALGNGEVYFSECAVHQFFDTSNSEDDVKTENCAFVGGAAAQGGGAVWFMAGYSRVNLLPVAGDCTLDYDFLFLGLAEFSLFGALIGTAAAFAGVVVEQFALLALQEANDGVTCLWGSSAAMDIQFAGRVLYEGSPTSAFTMSAGFTIGGQSTASTYVAELDAWHSGISCTWANLAADFGGMACRPDFGFASIGPDQFNRYSFTPAAIPLATLTQWVYMGAGVTQADGNVVSVQDTTTASAKTFTAPLVGNRPVYVASLAALNNLPAAQFIAANPSRLQDSSAAGAIVGDFFVMDVGIPTTSVLNPFWSSRGDAAGVAGTSSQTRIGLTAQNQADVYQDLVTPVVEDTVGYTPNASACIVGLEVRNTLRRRMLFSSPDRRLDRDLEVGGATWLTGAAEIGYDTAAVIGLNGYWAEHIALTSPSPALRDQCIAYAARKYAISLLP